MSALAQREVLTAPRWQHVRKLLAVRLDNLGDVLMTTPAFAAIRHSLPEASISLLTSPSGVMAAAHIPSIDEAIAFQAPWMKSSDPLTGGEHRRLMQMVKRLAAQHFDAAIIFTVCTQSALPAAMMCLMAGIPLRMAHSRENPYAMLTDWVPDTDVLDDGMRHEVLRQLGLVGTLGMQAPSQRLQFEITQRDVLQVGEKLCAAGVDPRKPYFVIHPGATAASRRYPVEHFGAAARLTVEQSDCQAVFTGSAGEAELVRTAQRVMGLPSVSLAGALSLGELGALIDGAQVLVSNNSGPVHIAAARGTPVVDLYALTNPQHTPWQVVCRVLHSDVPCRNCLKSVCPEGHHACLRNVPPHRVAKAALELIDRSGAPMVRSARLRLAVPTSANASSLTSVMRLTETE